MSDTKDRVPETPSASYDSDISEAVLFWFAEYAGGVIPADQLIREFDTLLLLLRFSGRVSS